MYFPLGIINGISKNKQLSTLLKLFKGTWNCHYCLSCKLPNFRIFHNLRIQQFRSIWLFLFLIIPFLFLSKIKLSFFYHFWLLLLRNIKPHLTKSILTKNSINYFTFFFTYLKRRHPANPKPTHFYSAPQNSLFYYKVFWTPFFHYTAFLFLFPLFCICPNWSLSRIHLSAFLNFLVQSNFFVFKNSGIYYQN